MHTSYQELFFFVKNTIWLMLCGEIIHIDSQNTTKHMDTHQGQNIEFMNLKQPLYTVNLLPQWVKFLHWKLPSCCGHIEHYGFRWSSPFSFIQHVIFYSDGIHVLWLCLSRTMQSISNTWPRLFLWFHYFFTSATSKHFFFESGLLTLFRDLANTLLDKPKKLADVNDLW
jgi:hypothetical protein